MNSKLLKYNKCLLMIFVVLQPFLNVLRGTSFRFISVFGFSVLELINIFIIGISSIFTLLTIKEKKFKIFYIMFFIILIMYLFFHYWNVSVFDNSLYLKNDHNFFKECYYLIRTFIVPLLLLINMWFCKFKKKDIVFLIKIISFICSFLIIIPNIFGFANLSYMGSKIDYNFFDWFTFKNTTNYSYYYLSSKGIFYSANQISAVMLMISPIILYDAYKNKTIFNNILLIMQTLAMFMLGTRTANIGIMLVFIVFLAMFLIFKLLKKSTNSIKNILIIFVVFCGLFMFSPIFYKYTANQKVETIASVADRMIRSEDVSLEDKEKLMSISAETYDEIMKGYELLNTIREFDCSNLSNDNIDLIKDYLVNYRFYNGIPTAIYNNYNSDNNLNFWCSYLGSNSSTDYRVLKLAIINNIYKLNNNKFDSLFGLGYTTGIMYTEVDYYYQFYNYGILGILLFVAPYILMLVYFGFSILKDFKNRFSLQNVMFGMALCLGLIIPYYSGHVFERVFPLSILALLSMLAISSFYEEKRNKKIIFISSTGGHLNEMLQLNDLINKYDSFIITEKTKSNMNLKNKYKNVNFLVYGTKDHLFSYLFKFSYNCVKSLFLYLIIRPDAIVTTGAHTAVPICYIGKLAGSKIIFIESFANSKTKTLSGRLVYPIADYFVVQWEDMLEFYPKAIYGGWIY